MDGVGLPCSYQLKISLTSHCTALWKQSARLHLEASLMSPLLRPRVFKRDRHCSILPTEDLQQVRVALIKHDEEELIALLDGAGIHLGPPRNSFASSNATRSRNGHHERTKTNEDLETKLSDRRSGTFGVVNGKLGARADAENGSERPRRRIDEEENESRTRRDYDRPKWSGRDDRADGEKPDDPTLRSTRDASAREKYNQPWTRKDKVADQEDSRRDSPAWRRGQRERDFERQDAEPEWVDSTETPEPARQHTHEDFLRWKESMTGKPTSDSKLVPVEEHTEKIVEPTVFAQPRIASDAMSGDKFFAKFEENKGSARPTKSRFANIFGPKEPTKTESESPISHLIPVAQPAELEQPVQHAEPGKKVDADFAKLLAMLGKNESSQAQSRTRPPRSPVNIAELASARSPDLPSNNTVPPHSTRTPLTSHTPQLSLDRLIESRSPAHHEQASQAKPGAQELLELLQRSNLQDRQEPRQPAYAQQEQRTVPPPPGLSGFHDHDRPGPPLISTRRETSRSIFDDPAFAGFRNERQQHHQPQQMSSPPEHGGGLESLLAYMQKGYQGYGEQRPQQNPPMPPGLQRPPGLDSRPPAGWSGNPPPPPPQAQRQPSHHMPSYSLGPQPNMFANPTQNVYPQATQQRDQRLPPQRKPTGDMPGFTNYPPPGFGPSPTYASSTPPDPYGAAIRNDYNMAGRDRLDRQVPGPPLPPQQNPFAAMYGGAGNGRSGGGAQLPPGFR